MNTEVPDTSDLFEVDKRLTLKPVIDFNDFLRMAFGDGNCRCVRCIKSNGHETGYEHQHTFNLEGVVVNRRFAQTTASDVLQVMKKAWSSYFKSEMSVTRTLELSSIQEFVEPMLQNRLRSLVLASGLATEIDGQLEFKVVLE